MLNFESWVLTSDRLWYNHFSWCQAEDIIDFCSFVEFVDEAKNYWDDGYDDVVEEIKEYTDCDFKKPIGDRI